MSENDMPEGAEAPVMRPEDAAPRGWRRGVAAVLKYAPVVPALVAPMMALILYRQTGILDDQAQAALNQARPYVGLSVTEEEGGGILVVDAKNFGSLPASIVREPTITAHTTQTERFDVPPADIGLLYPGDSDPIYNGPTPEGFTARLGEAGGDATLCVCLLYRLLGDRSRKTWAAWGAYAWEPALRKFRVLRQGDRSVDSHETDCSAAETCNGE